MMAPVALEKPNQDPRNEKALHLLLNKERKKGLPPDQICINLSQV
jgi:hypothetical protein